MLKLKSWIIPTNIKIERKHSRIGIFENFILFGHVPFMYSISLHRNFIANLHTDHINSVSILNSRKLIFHQISSNDSKYSQTSRKCRHVDMSIFHSIGFEYYSTTIIANIATKFYQVREFASSVSTFHFLKKIQKLHIFHNNMEIFQSIWNWFGIKWGWYNSDSLWYFSRIIIMIYSFIILSSLSKIIDISGNWKILKF